jgi:N-acetylglucosaminyl-diphospho-decaprenol L-rhamnosyltransferase
VSATTVSVIVPLYNGRDLIEECLESIPSHAEVIVVDDASSDGAPDLVAARFPSARLERNAVNRGFAGTCNVGLRLATGDVRLVLNSDARLAPGALDALVGAFDADGVGIAGPRLVFADGSHQTSAAAFPTVATVVSGSFLLNDIVRLVMRKRRFVLELGMARADHDHDHDVEWVHGACLAISAACFDATGGFDEGYYMYNEETDLCWRAREAGFRVRYVASARTVHLGGGSTGDPTVHATRLIRSEARFFARAYGRGVLRRWAAARVGGAAIKLVVLALPALFSTRVRVRWRWQLAAMTAVLRGDWKESVATA